MRRGLVALVVVSTGCNALLGIDDLEVPPSDCVGVCECKVDDDCPLSTYCNDTGVDRTCECVAGFTRTGDEPACTWTGVLPDPELEDDGGWTVPGADAGFVVANDGMKYLVFASPVPRVSRTITMPRLARSGPLVLELAHLSVDEQGDPNGNDDAESAPAFALASHWRDTPPKRITGPATSYFCLGSSHYAPADSSGPGIEVTFELAAALDSLLDGNGGNRKSSFAYTRANIAPAEPGACPDLGTFSNGDAEVSDIWEFTAGTGGRAGYLDEMGENGSRAIEVVTAQRCSASSVHGRVHVPEGASAIQFFARTTAAGYQSIALDDVQHVAFVGDEAKTRYTFCVDPHHRGTIRSASYTAIAPGTCGEPVAVGAILDSFTVVDEPSCGTTGIVDGGFESSYTSPFLIAVANRGSARVRTDDSSLAHSGNGVVELRETLTCSGATAARYVIVRDVTGGGPAIAFWYRGKGPLSANGRVVTATDQWLRGVACIDPRVADRRGVVAFSIPNATTCDGAADRTIYIDDLEVVSDPGCPQ